MEISWIQAALLGLFACLSSMPGLGGTSFGNYTLGRPLVGGLVCGIILGDIQTGILVGIAMQVVYIALVTPGGTVSADVRAVSYIGIPLAMIAIKSYGLDAASSDGAALATSFGTMVGTLGTVLFYGTATINLAWQHIGWRAVENGDYKKLYIVDMVLPWISHILCSFIPANGPINPARNPFIVSSSTSSAPLARASSNPAVIPTITEPTCGSVLKKAVYVLMAFARASFLSYNSSTIGNIEHK